MSYPKINAPLLAATDGHMVAWIKRADLFAADSKTRIDPEPLFPAGTFAGWGRGW